MTTSLKDFQIISKLGEGAYSSVYKVKRLSDSQEYALKKVKLMNLSDKEKQNALNEVRILASVKHANLIGYKEAFLEDNASLLCIIMEYADNGDLFQKILEHQKSGTNFPEAEIWNIFIQMTKALKALHDLKIFHRDLKSANVFLNKDGTVKLGDLNVSKIAKKGLLYTQTGTPYYASPEVWRDMPYDNKSDVWSLGCVVYEITTLKPPFRAEDMEGLYKKVLKGYYPRIPTSFSQDLNNVIRALLQVSPHLRPSCDKVLQLPSIAKRLEEKHLIEVESDPNNVLLSTIRIPKNLHFLTDRLPKADYNPYKLKKVEKKKFLHTLAGYREKNVTSHAMEDAARNSESVDSFKRDENGKMYLPPVTKEAQHKDIMKIYGGGPAAVKERREQLKKELTRISADESLYEQESDISTVKKRAADYRKGPRRSVDTENDPSVVEEDRSVSKRKEPMNVNRLKQAPEQKIAYKVHDMNKDVLFEKPNANIKNYGVRDIRNNHSNNDALLMYKDAPHLKRIGGGIKPQHMPGRSPSNDLKQAKLPPLASGKLPQLNGVAKGYGNASPRKGRPNELGKVYKVNNGGGLDDLSEKYMISNKGIAPRGRPMDSKNYASVGNRENLNYGKHRGEFDDY